MLTEETVQKDRRIEEREARLMRALLRPDERERRLAKDRHTRSTLPSSDGVKHMLKPQQRKSTPSGGQPGHQGQALHHAEPPHEVITHRPEYGEACRRAVEEIAGQIKERRHIHELPDRRVRVMEHRVEAMCCPACQHVTAAHVPVGVHAPAHDGPQMHALAISLSPFQVLPMERIQPVCGDVFGCPHSEGTLATWIHDAARTLGPTMLILTQALFRSRADLGDETGARVKGLLHGFHVHATRWLTLSSWHRTRGREAMDACGIVPHDTGRAIPDRVSRDDHSPCQHRVCGAHL